MHTALKNLKMMLPLVLLAAAAVALPTAPPASSKLVVTKDFYPEAHLMYSGSYDIVEIVVPLNDLNDVNQLFSCSDSHENSDEPQHLSYVFFVEAELQEDAIKNYKGVYVFKNGKAKKVLENGQTVTYGHDKTVYIGASDGIYKYNYVDDTVEKYGSVSESVIKMAIDTFHGTIYYLTADYVLYKFADNEVKSTKVEAVKDARDIVFDYDGRMFYYDGSKQIYLYNHNQIIKIDGLPSNPAKVILIRAPVLLNKLYFVIDGSLYEIDNEGKSKKMSVEFNALPSAFAPETYLIQFIAYNKKIYEYNVVAVLMNNEIKALNAYLSGKEEEIEVISKTKPKIFKQL